MFDIFGPILKTWAQLEERRYDMNRSDRNSERYHIPMHRKNFWTNKWMILEIIFCRSITVIPVRSTGKFGII
jgi:hypothetical protein